MEAAFDASLHLPLKGIHNTRPKAERIEGLEMPIENGQILFKKDQVALIQCLEDWPEGEHDDAADSLAGAYFASKLNKPFAHQERTVSARPTLKQWWGSL